MSVLAHETGSARDVLPAQAERRAALFSLLRSWELYLILAVALFLRLYHIGLTEFDGDQATIFRMAHDAVSHGMFVATSNQASIGIINPPAVIYLLMITAAFSSNPVWGAVLTALMAVLAVMLTYLFVRRYFGRVAATIAALTYAVAYKAIFYSRFMWNQNFLHLFVILFFFALFWGVVERRKGWLFPALFLVGLMAQLHATGALLAAPLVVAIVLAPDTIRWRDLFLGLVSLVIIYLPYLFWEFAVKFSDINLLLHPAKHPTILDNEALLFYQSYLSPFQEPFTERRSVLYHFAPWFGWLTVTLTVLVIAGAVLALLLVIWPGRKEPLSPSLTESPVPFWRRGLFGWWLNLRATPLRSGLIVLLVWQIAPLVYLSRHSLPIYAHYFIIFMPGQFILFAFFITKAAEWLSRRGHIGGVTQYVLYYISGLVIVALLLASVGQLVDLNRGNYGDGNLSYPYYNDLSSIEYAMTAADALAQQQHLHHVYISTDDTQTAYQYFSERMHTPTTLFDKRHCMVLPDPAAGPAVMLVGPYNTITNDLLAHYAKATLVSMPPRRGGDPYRLYIVNGLPATVSVPAPEHTFTGNLRLLDAQAQTMYLGKAQRLITRWQLLRSGAPSSRVSYNYHFIVSTPGLSREVAQGTCFLTALNAGDQVIMALSQYVANPLPMPLLLRVNYQEIHPSNLMVGPFTFETIRDVGTQVRQLVTGQGKESISLALSS